MNKTVVGFQTIHLIAINDPEACLLIMDAISVS